MANNRIVLVCKICKVGITIAKYFPSSGWYPPMGPSSPVYPGDEERTDKERAAFKTTRGLKKNMESFLERHEHDLKGITGGMYGGYQFETRYEVPEGEPGKDDEWQFESMTERRKHD